MNSSLVKEIKILSYSDISKEDYSNAVSKICNNVHFTPNKDANYCFESYIDYSSWSYDENFLYYGNFCNKLVSNKFYNKSVYIGEILILLICKCSSGVNKFKIFLKENLKNYTQSELIDLKKEADHLFEIINRNMFEEELGSTFLINEKDKSYFEIIEYKNDIKISIGSICEDDPKESRKLKKRTISIEKIINEKLESGFIQIEKSKYYTEILNYLRPDIKPAAGITLQKDTFIKESQLKSHFGGIPYFEKNEKWPINDDGLPFNFIFQVFNNETLPIPQNIKLIQFFYDWENFDYDDSTCFIKIYTHLNDENVIKIKHPTLKKENKTKYCLIDFDLKVSLPNINNLPVSNYLKEVCQIENLEDNYFTNSVIDKITNGSSEQSRIGGYADWIQNDETPQGDYMLLFQIQTEENANVVWGDFASVYVFYNLKTFETKFILQSH